MDRNGPKLRARNMQTAFARIGERGGVQKRPRYAAAAPQQVWRSRVASSDPFAGLRVRDNTWLIEGAHRMQSPKNTRIAQQLQRATSATRQHKKSRSVHSASSSRQDMAPQYALNNSNVKKQINKKKSNATPESVAPPCFYFMRFGYCLRGDECFYTHDPSTVAICDAFIKGSCTTNACPLRHETEHSRLPICRHFLHDACLDQHCPYPHCLHAPGAQICKKFQRGDCDLETECNSIHSFVCHDWFASGGTACSFVGRCPFLHPQDVSLVSDVSEAEQFARERAREPCKYMKSFGICMRGDSCFYSHDPVVLAGNNARRANGDAELMTEALGIDRSRLIERSEDIQVFDPKTGTIKIVTKRTLIKQQEESDTDSEGSIEKAQREATEEFFHNEFLAKYTPDLREYYPDSANDGETELDTSHEGRDADVSDFEPPARKSKIQKKTR